MLQTEKQWVSAGGLFLAVLAAGGSGAWKQDGRAPTFYDPPDAYDVAAIHQDPDKYYAQSVPSRVWQTATVPPNEARHEELAIVGEAFLLTTEHQRLDQPLRVRGQPGRPVTFTALDQGQFANGRQSITVPADEHGYAEVEFVVADAGEFRVLAGSPESHGPAEFLIQACSAKMLADVRSGAYAEQYWSEFRTSPLAEQLFAADSIPSE